MKRSRPIIFALAVVFILTLMISAVLAQSVEFSVPWKNSQIALALDPYEGIEIDWEQLASDTRVVAINDMDVDVYNGTIEELKSKWPFAE
jgi:hypothetical protein